MSNFSTVPERGLRTRSLFKLWGLILIVGLTGLPSGAARSIESPFVGVGDAALTRLVHYGSSPELSAARPAPPERSSFLDASPPQQPGYWPLGVALLLGVPISLQHLGADDFELLPGIGPVLARRIVTTRSARGGFFELDDLRSVSGIGPHKMAAIREALRLSGAAVEPARHVQPHIESATDTRLAQQSSPS